MEIRRMKKESINEYAKLFVNVFNNEPWNDKWTVETASVRIDGIVRTNNFIGCALYDDTRLVGFICGQKEQFYDGMHFQVQEFCVDTAEQGKGYGTMLLNSLQFILKEDKVSNIYLITSKGPGTEGFYRKKGFSISDNMVLMSKNEL